MKRQQSSVTDREGPVLAVPRNFARILVFRIGHLGDTIVAIPAFRAIRNAFPDAHITFLSNSDPANSHRVAARSVLPETGLFNNWRVYPRARSAFGRVIPYTSLLRELRRQRFDSVFYLMTRNRSAASIKRDRMFFRAAGIATIVGDRYLLENLLDPSMNRPLPSTQRESEFLLETLAAEGIPVSEPSCDLQLSTDEHRRADDWLEEHCGSDYRKQTLIAISPGSNWASKVWREASYVEVTQSLIDRHRAVPVIFGGPEDREKGDRLIRALGSGANAAGPLNVREAAAAMRHARLYLGNDSGSMHMAAAVGVPCVAIFAAIDFPGRWYPFGEGHQIFRVAVECEGCLTPNCFNAHKCLEAILPEQVLAACNRILESTRAAPPSSPPESVS